MTSRLSPLRMSLLTGIILLMSSSAGLAADVTLAWDANTESALAGYKLYYGTSSRTYGTPITVGNVTTYTVTGLGTGTYYFAVTAYDTSGVETTYSNEATATLSGPDTTPPVATGAFEAA